MDQEEEKEVSPADIERDGDQNAKDILQYFEEVPSLEEIADEEAIDAADIQIKERDQYPVE